MAATRGVGVRKRGRMSRIYRWLAFSLLACAAFAVGVPGLDRAGTAVLGVACMALAIPPVVSRASRREASLELAGFEDVTGAAEAQVHDLLGRLEAYGGAGSRASAP